MMGGLARIVRPHVWTIVPPRARTNLRPRAWTRDATAVRYATCVCGLALFLACGTAQGASVFTVAAVPVDAEAASSAEARELAIADGQRAALEILLRRLTVAGAALPAPEAEALAAMISGFAIDGELVSTTRYRASLTVDFDPTAVRDLLRGNGVAYAETMSKPVLVVAVQRDAGGVLLWEDGNFWRRAWEERPPHRGLVPLLLPLGDVIDLVTVDAAEALTADAASLAELAALYGTSEAMVAVAGLSGTAAVAKPTAPDSPDAGSADGEASAAGRALSLSLRRAAAGGGRAVERVLIGRTGESERALLERGVARIVALLEDDWKAANLIRYDEERALRLAVPIESLGAWVSIQRQLAALAMVSAVVIESLSLGEGRFALRYHGTEDQLRLALDQADLALAPAADGWTLQRRAAGSAAGGAD